MWMISMTRGAINRKVYFRTNNKFWGDFFFWSKPTIKDYNNVAFVRKEKLVCRQI